jgi:hypothetical protein
MKAHQGPAWWARGVLLALVAGFVGGGCIKPPPPPLQPPLPPPSPAATAQSSPRCVGFRSCTDEGYGLLENTQTVQQEAAGFPPYGDGWKKLEKVDELLVQFASMGSGTEAEKQKNLVALRGLLAEIGDRKMSTQYENPMTFFLIERVKKKVERAAATRKLPYVDIAIGTAPQFFVGAANNQARTGERAIIFQTELLNAVNRLSQAMGQAVDMDRDESSIGIALSNERVASFFSSGNAADAKRFVDVFLEYARLSRGEVYKLDDLHRFLQLRLTDAMEVFVFSHEITHAIKNHEVYYLQAFPAEPGRAESLGLGLREAVPSWRHELEADAIGLDLLVEVCKQEASSSIPEICAVAPTLMLELSGYCERVASIRETRIDPALVATPIERTAAAAMNACLSRGDLLSCAEFEGLSSAAGHLPDHPPTDIRVRYLKARRAQAYPELEQAARLLEPGMEKILADGWALASPVIFAHPKKP